MRRISIIFLCVLVAFAAGCSKYTDTKVPVAEEDAWKYDVTLPVPISFGAEGVSTKAMVNSLTDMNKLSFGVFAFDKNASDLRAEDNLMMRNAVAMCKVSGESGSLNLEDLWYYPIYSDRCFNFYSYHSGEVASAGVTVESRRAFVTIPVGGVEDVLYAKSVAEPIYKDPFDGFNGDYLRAGGTAPSFAYEHPTACVSFKAALNEGVEGVKVTLSSMHVTLPRSADLCIRNIDKPELEGTFISVGDPVEFIVINDSYTGNLNMTLTAEPQTFCKDLFIVPGDKSFSIRVIYKVTNPGSDNVMDTADDVTQTFEVTRDVELEEEDAVFERNNRYAFVLKVSAPEQVSVKIEGVDKYESAFGEGDYNPEDYK